MRVDVVTLFPEMFTAISEFGITRRAIERDLLQLASWNPRDYTEDSHRTVDDRPYGGGPGMVMMMQPLKDAITAAKGTDSTAKVIYLSPQGRRFDQLAAKQMAKNEHLIFVSGRYEGVDERLMSLVDEEWSIGDYITTGGELPTMVMIDTLARLLPGALGHAESAEQDSFSAGLLDYPHYTRPALFEGQRVPSVLMAGDHEKIRRWRLKQSLGRTWQRRPDLLEQLEPEGEQRDLLTEFIKEHKLKSV